MPLVIGGNAVQNEDRLGLCDLIFTLISSFYFRYKLTFYIYRQ